MSRYYPHMGSNDWGDVLSQNTEIAESNFDYSRWAGGTKLKLLNVAWDSEYKNVVKFDNNSERDKWFSSKTGEVIELESECQIQPDGSVRLPIPQGTLQNFNYIEVTMPLPTSPSDPLHYANPETHIDKWHYFITDTRYIAPNCVEATLQPDFWTTFINDITVNYMMLTRGHAPLSKTSVEKYLSDPINNNEYLLAEDWNAGIADNIKGSKYYPIGNGVKWACFAMKCTPEKLVNMQEMKDIVYTNDVKAPSAGSYYLRAGRYPYEEYQKGAMPAGDGDGVVYNWENRGLYNTYPQDLETYITIHDDDWRYSFKDPNGQVAEASTIMTDGDTVAPCLIGVRADDMEDVLDAVRQKAPAFFDLIECCFILSQEHLTLGEAFNFCGQQFRVIKPASNPVITNLKFEKSDFDFDPKYADLAKLYTSPYSVLELTDNEQTIAQIQIERTSTNLGIERRVCLAYPYLSVEVFLQGVGGDDKAEYTWRNIEGNDEEKYLPSGDLGTFWRSYNIPTFAIYQTAWERESLQDYYERQAAAWSAKMAEYIPATHSVNNNWANTIHDAINEYYSQLGRHPNIYQDDYSYWWSKGGEPNLPTDADLTHDPDDFAYNWKDSWQKIDDYQGNIEADYDRTVGLADEGRNDRNRSADASARDRTNTGEGGKEDRIGMATVNDENRRTVSTASREASEETALANKDSRNKITATNYDNEVSSINNTHSNAIKSINRVAANSKDTLDAAKYTAQNAQNEEYWASLLSAQHNYLLGKNKLHFEELNRFRGLYYDASKLQRDNVYNQNNILEDKNLMRDSVAHTVHNERGSSMVEGASGSLTSALEGAQGGALIASSGAEISAGGAIIAGAASLGIGLGIGAAVGVANYALNQMVTGIQISQEIQTAAIQARSNQRKANMTYEKNADDFKETAELTKQTSNSILDYTNVTLQASYNTSNQISYQAYNTQKTNTDIIAKRDSNLMNRDKDTDTSIADADQITNLEIARKTKETDDEAAKIIYDATIEAARINDNANQVMSPKILAETIKQATNVERINREEAENQRVTSHTSADAIYDETEDRAKEAGEAQARAVMQSYHNTTENAERTKWVGEFATQRAYEAKFKNQIAKVDDEKLHAPYTHGSYSLSQLDNAMKMRGVSVKIKTQSKDAIAQVGDRFLRYGYALNRAWHLNNMNDLKCMREFSYWECGEVWLSGSNGTIENAQETIRGILLTGTTVWSDPDKVGKVSIYNNEVK